MKKMNILFIFLFCAALVLPPLLGMLIPTVTGSEENRALTALPDILDGDIFTWTERMDDYVVEHLPFKENMVKIWAGLTYDLFHESVNPHVVIGKDGWLFYNGYEQGNPVNDLVGNNSLSPDEENEIRQKAAELQRMHPRLRATLLIAPNKETVYRDFFPEGYAESFVTKTRAEKLAEQERECDEGTIVYPIKQFQELRERYQPYYKYDTHWNALGAYVGLQTVCEKLGMAIPDMREVDYIAMGTPIRRDLAYLAHLEERCGDDQEYEVTPNAGVTVQRGEVRFLFPDSNAYISEYTSNAPNGQTMILAGDSYGEIMAELAAKCFQRVIFLRRDEEKTIEIHDLLEDILQNESDGLFIMEVVERDLEGLLWHDVPY